MKTIVFATATSLAAAIRQRQITAVEVLEAHLAQMARHNPALDKDVPPIRLDEFYRQGSCRGLAVWMPRRKSVSPPKAFPL